MLRCIVDKGSGSFYNEKAGASGDEAVRNAGYIVYAYLGGQAKRDYSGAMEGGMMILM